MKKSILLCYLGLLSLGLHAQESKTDLTVNNVPEKVRVGIYINSIHDIDFKLKEFMVSFWLWIKYKKSNDKKNDLDFVNNLEIPNAETSTRSYLVVDSTSSPDSVFMMMKMLCEMKDNWSIRNFPFDKQMMNISIENSQFSSDQMIFIIDSVGNHYDSSAVYGWNIEYDKMWVENKVYYSKFGVDDLPKSESNFSAFKVRVGIERNAAGLFWKMFLGMYIAFLIAYICFYIHSDGMDSRFGLSVGSLFAVIGNKYIIDSSLPESTSFTLVDTLHGLTLFSIFLVIAATAWSLKLVKQNKISQARRFDMIFAQVLLTLYIIANAWFIYNANKAT